MTKTNETQILQEKRELITKSENKEMHKRRKRKDPTKRN